MTRRQVGSAAVVVIVSTLLGLIGIALMPVWLPVLTVKPSIVQPLNDKIMQVMMRQMTHMIFKRPAAKPSPVK